MGEDRVCIAGVDNAGVTCRPVLPQGTRRKHLFRDGQVIIRPRAILRARLAPIRSAAPHSEDCRWQWPEWSLCVGLVDEDCWQQKLHELAANCPRPLFGAGLRCHKGARRRKLNPDTASFSLATLADVRIQDFVYAPERGSPFRIYFRDGNDEFYDDIPVTDLALHELARSRVRWGQRLEAVSVDMARKLKAPEKVILRVGLGRNRYGWCWLQVNGIYTFPDWLEGRCFADFEDRQPRLL